LPDSQNILLVDNHDSFTFNLAALVTGCGHGCDVVPIDALDFGRAEEYRKILISPGPGVPSEAGRLLDLIRTFSPAKSILGICLGHQAIGEAFGAGLGLMPRPEHGIRRRVRVGEKGGRLFDRMPREFEAGVYHSWFVEAKNLPACLRVTATADDGSIMAISHSEYDVHGIQFHPESVMTPLGPRVIMNWLARR